jgi:hypothetical protein
VENLLPGNKKATLDCVFERTLPSQDHFLFQFRSRIIMDTTTNESDKVSSSSPSTVVLMPRDRPATCPDKPADDDM